MARYRHKNGKIEAWARRPILEGEEVTISYRSCECSYPGLPWDVYLCRQQSLSDGYLFECGCAACESGVPGLESSLCLNQVGIP